MNLTLQILPNKFSILRYSEEKNISNWIKNSSFYSISRSEEEFSVVCETSSIPKNENFEKTEENFIALKIVGILDFSLTGILSSIALPLAQAKISIFAISTFDTDYILLREENLEQAKNTLSSFCIFI